MYQPAERVPRDNFGGVDPFMPSTRLRLQDLDNLVYPNTSATVSMRVPLPIFCKAGRCPKMLMRYSLYWRQYLMLKE